MLETKKREIIELPTPICWQTEVYSNPDYSLTVTCKNPSMDEAERQVRNCVADFIDKAGTDLDRKTLQLTINGLDELIKNSSDLVLSVNPPYVVDGVKKDIRFNNFSYKDCHCYITPIMHKTNILIVSFYFKPQLDT